MSGHSMDRHKYNKMEPVLQYISKNFVTLNKADIKKTNPILHTVISELKQAMKSINPLFKNLFTDILYKGSYYEGLKVSKPEEFDIDFTLMLPKLVDAKLELSEHHGYVNINLKGWSSFRKSCEFEKFKDIERFKDKNNFLLTSEFLLWMEETVEQALNTFNKNKNNFLIPYKENKNIVVSLNKFYPALMLKISYDDIYIDVDLLTVFKFPQEQWPPSPFKPNPGKYKKKNFLLVPDSPPDALNRNKCWRTCFSQQEQLLIHGKYSCKPVIRFMKKLRNANNHKEVYSYFIKTIFLHEIIKQPSHFWNAPQSYILMHMLKTYKSYLENYNIPSYWNTNKNLLKQIDKETLDEIKKRLDIIINEIERNIEENPSIIAKYLLTSTELKTMKQNKQEFFFKPSQHI